MRSATEYGPGELPAVPIPDGHGQLSWPLAVPGVQRPLDEANEVIIRFQRNVDLKRVESMIDVCVGDYGMNLVIRPMDLKKYFLETL